MKNDPPASRRVVEKEIEVHLTVEDYRAFTDYIAEKAVDSGSGVRGCIGPIVLAIVWMVALTILFMLNDIGVFAFHFSTFLITFIATAASCRYFYRHTVHYEPSESGTVLGTHRILLRDDGLWNIGKVGEARLDWAAVHAVEEDKNHLYVFTGRFEAIFIPKRAFSDEHAVADFKWSLEHFRSHALPR